MRCPVPCSAKQRQARLAALEQQWEQQRGQAGGPAEPHLGDDTTEESEGEVSHFRMRQGEVQEAADAGGAGRQAWPGAPSCKPACPAVHAAPLATVAVPAGHGVRPPCYGLFALLQQPQSMATWPGSAPSPSLALTPRAMLCLALLCFPVFRDADDEYGSLAAVKQRLEEWKARQPGAYRDAYVSLSAPALFAPFVRLELLKWRPLHGGDVGEPWAAGQRAGGAGRAGHCTGAPCW